MSPVPGRPAPIPTPRFVNCTSHTIRVYLAAYIGDDEPCFVDLPPSGMLARVTESRNRTGLVQFDASNSNLTESYTVPVYESVFGHVVGLPDPEDGVAYVVSRLVCEALPARRDLYFPDDSIRIDAAANSDSSIKLHAVAGCRSLSQACQAAPRVYRENYANSKPKCRHPYGGTAASSPRQRRFPD